MKKEVKVHYKGITERINCKFLRKIILPRTFVGQSLLEFSDSILLHPAVHRLKV